MRAAATSLTKAVTKKDTSNKKAKKQLMTNNCKDKRGNEKR